MGVAREGKGKIPPAQREKVLQKTGADILGSEGSIYSKDFSKNN